MNLKARRRLVLFSKENYKLHVMNIMSGFLFWALHVAGDPVCYSGKTLDDLNTVISITDCNGDPDEIYQRFNSRRDVVWRYLLPIMCYGKDLPKVARGSFSCVGYSVGDKCALTCDDAFFILSSNETICQQNDQLSAIWSDGNFECAAVTCSKNDLPIVAGGTFNCSGYSVGDTCTLKCDDAFYVLSSNETICQQNDQYTGIWSDGNFECAEIKCSEGNLPKVTNGTFMCPTHPDILPGEMCAFTCHYPSYSLQSEQAVCGKGDTGGEWTRANFSCRTINCDEWNLWSRNTYKWIEEHLRWDAARSLCQGIDAHLVNIVDQEENNFVHMILSHCIQPNEEYSWIGLGDLEKNDKWEWSNGESSSYRNWDQNNSQPNNRPTEDYAVMKKELGKWSDVLATATFPAVCERKK